jgi:sec-independent protein translocase protein TatB
MLDLGLDKLALIGAVALIVIGPEKLPKVARTVGHMMGKARRYVADVKAEVNRSIEMEELAKARKQFEDAAHEVGFERCRQQLQRGGAGPQRALSTPTPGTQHRHLRAPRRRRKTGASSAAARRNGSSRPPGCASMCRAAPRASSDTVDEFKPARPAR